MKKETLIEILDHLDSCGYLNYDPAHINRLADTLLISINEASNESLSVRDNEGKEKKCHIKSRYIHLVVRSDVSNLQN